MISAAAARIKTMMASNQTSPMAHIIPGIILSIIMVQLAWPAFPQPIDALRGAFNVRIRLASKDQILTWERIHLRYWTIGIKQYHGAKLRPLLPTSQQFMAGKLDGARHGPNVAFLRTGQRGAGPC